MKDHVGMDRGNHIHGGLAAQPTICGERETKSIASNAMDMHCRKELNGKQPAFATAMQPIRQQTNDAAISVQAKKAIRRSRLKKVRRKKIHT